MKFRIIAKHSNSGMIRTFILEGDSIKTVAEYFSLKYENMELYRIDPLDDNLKEVSETKGVSKIYPNRQRSYYKARLCQIRGNLQSMTDSEDELLTCEEVVQIQRLTARVDRIISLFHTRTMDLKNEGKL